MFMAYGYPDKKNPYQIQKNEQPIESLLACFGVLHSKNSATDGIIFAYFGLLTEAAIMACKVLSKELRPQVKNSRIFFINSISASSPWILMTSV